MFLIITIIFAIFFKCFNSSHTHPPTNSEPAVKLATRKQNICLQIFSRWKYQPSSTPWSRKLVLKVYFVQDVLHIIKRNWNVFQLFTSVTSCDPYLWRRVRLREVAWPSVQRIGLAIRRSRPGTVFASCWICSRSSRVQILGHACNCKQLVAFFTTVSLYSNYFFVIIRVECL